MNMSMKTAQRVPYFTLLRIAARNPAIECVKPKLLKKVLNRFDAYKLAPDEQKQQMEQKASGRIGRILEGEYLAGPAELEYRVKGIRTLQTAERDLLHQMAMEMRQELTCGTDMPLPPKEKAVNQELEKELDELEQLTDKQHEIRGKRIGMLTRLAYMNLWQKQPDMRFGRFKGAFAMTGIMAALDGLLVAAIAQGGVNIPGPDWMFWASMAAANIAVAGFTYLTFKEYPYLKELAQNLHAAVKHSVQEIE